MRNRREKNVERPALIGEEFDDCSRSSSSQSLRPICRRPTPPASQSNTTSPRLATPISRSSTPSSRLATPTSQVSSPSPRLAPRERLSATSSRATTPPVGDVDTTLCVNVEPPTHVTVKLLKPTNSRRNTTRPVRDLDSAHSVNSTTSSPVLPVTKASSRFRKMVASCRTADTF